jgi:hypothetical protein
MPALKENGFQEQKSINSAPGISYPSNPGSLQISENFKHRYWFTARLSYTYFRGYFSLLRVVTSKITAAASTIALTMYW